MIIKQQPFFYQLKREVLRNNLELIKLGRRMENWDSHNVFYISGVLVQLVLKNVIWKSAKCASRPLGTRNVAQNSNSRVWGLRIILAKVVWFMPELKIFLECINPCRCWKAHWFMKQNIKHRDVLQQFNFLKWIVYFNTKCEHFCTIKYCIVNIPSTCWQDRGSNQCNPRGGASPSIVKAFARYTG